jgi:2-dehydro-3-deoxy-D-gluconate 5-dehydrogenase
MTQLPAGQLSGQVAIVTGGGRGIGKAVAVAYAREGARVAITARGEDEIEAAAEEIRAFGGEALAVAADVCRESDVDQMVARVLEQWGQVDILFNAAGIRAIFPSDEITLEQWQAVVDTNLTASFVCSQRVFPSMQQRGRGKIIMVGSIMSHSGAPARAAYVATKTGLVGLTRALGVEWAPFGINVNILSPGYIATDIVMHLVETGQLNLEAIQKRTPMGRIGELQDLIGPAIFLASPASDFMCGQALVIDGGWLANGFLIH